jgi:hypothetical protein
MYANAARETGTLLLMRTIQKRESASRNVIASKPRENARLNRVRYADQLIAAVNGFRLGWHRAQRRCEVLVKPMPD